MDEYYGAIRSGQGGLFLAVCRGKVRWEGGRGWVVAAGWVWVGGVEVGVGAVSLTVSAAGRGLLRAR